MPGDPSRAAELEAFVAEHGERLLRAAIFLAGNRESGEDMLQNALERLLRHWRSVRDNPERYTRRILVHLAADGWRRHAVRRGKLGLLRASTPAYQPDGTADIDRRDEVVGLLQQLPVRQRTAIVLRYLEGLTETETAELMGCSAGTVKSTTSRGLDKLRDLPVRIVQVWADTTLSSADIQMDMRWLPPTPANQANLTLHIPAGFTQKPWS